MSYVQFNTLIYDKDRSDSHYIMEVVVTGDQNEKAVYNPHRNLHTCPPLPVHPVYTQHNIQLYTLNIQVSLLTG